MEAATRFDAGATFTYANGIMAFEDGRDHLPFDFEADAQTLMHDNTILISAVIYRRDLHAALGRFDELVGRPQFAIFVSQAHQQFKSWRRAAISQDPYRLRKQQQRAGAQAFAQVRCREHLVIAAYQRGAAGAVDLDSRATAILGQFQRRVRIDGEAVEGLLRIVYFHHAHGQRHRRGVIRQPHRWKP